MFPLNNNNLRRQHMEVRIPTTNLHRITTTWYNQLMRANNIVSLFGHTKCYTKSGLHNNNNPNNFINKFMQQRDGV